jgi:hypothetical protein
MFAVSSTDVIVGNAVRNGAFSQDITITGNTVYGVYMFATAFTTDSFGTERASAVIDPEIRFDPNFAEPISA